jgi:lipopolysaccharide transport system ATP-binding protein
MDISGNPVIQVNGLGKKYRIGGPRKTYLTLRDAIVNTAKVPFHRLSRSDSGKSANEFWAIRDLTFNVSKGEVVGIIGRNGAGKSTLLKILSRITYPTVGEITLHGRVGSLLEVGTGFHTELTGRENVFLSGSILGMQKREIEDKFDEIVKFSEIEKFIDTPVKRYSSGMYVRLAFAVAAHLDTDILLVDEVLAVGDATFQKKCLGKMGDITHEGKTILFVSHNMTAIKALCSRSIVIEAGQIKFDGDSTEAIDYYLRSNILSKKKNLSIADRKREHHCSLRAKIIEITVISDGQKNPGTIDPFKPLTVQLKLEAKSEVRCSATLYILDDIHNISMFDSRFISGQDVNLEPGINAIECRINPLKLYAGEYLIKAELNIHGQEIIDRVPDAYSFTVVECDPNKTGYNIKKGVSGVFYIEHEWEL